MRIWRVIYGALKIAQATSCGAPILEEFSWWMLLTGLSLPLWFLPFINIANGLAVTYRTHIVWPNTLWARGAEGVILWLLSAGATLVSATLPIPATQWALGLAAGIASFGAPCGPVDARAQNSKPDHTDQPDRRANFSARLCIAPRGGQCPASTRDSDRHSNSRRGFDPTSSNINRPTFSPDATRPCTVDRNTTLSQAWIVFNAAHRSQFHKIEES